MIDMNEFFDLLETGAIETYRGTVDVLTDRKSGRVVIGQGERIIVMDVEQATFLVQVLLHKLESLE